MQMSLTQSDVPTRGREVRATGATQAHPFTFGRMVLLVLLFFAAMC